MASVNQGTGRKSSPASFTSMTPPEARAAYEKLAAATPRRAEVETVRDIEIPAETGTFRGRLYRPKEAPALLTRMTLRSGVSRQPPGSL